jgi:hypothetical protein
MFGHDNQSQHQDAVQADGAITSDDQAMGAAATGDTTGEYIDTPSTPTAPTPAEAQLPEVVAPAVAAPVVAAATTSAPAVEPHPETDALLDLKQQALQQLTPLVDHLEQNPEEKFRTTMMMIQAADNASLIKAAYDAALQIPDEKVRAQALLDIVNEINYFTHNNDSSAAA